MRIGIDLGGSKIEALALDAGGREILRRRIATPAGDYGATLSAIATLVAEIEHATGARGTIGLGTPGAISPATGLIKNANSTCLIGHALDRDLEKLLGRPVRVANDANCFALSESVDGAGAGAESVFGVILGTGVGGGIAIARRVLVGANAIAGEWGHNPLPWPRDEERPGPLCYCGRHGCIESFLSGPALARDHVEATGERLEADEIARRAGAGDARAEATLARYEERLARALASVINLLDPDAIVLGGGLSLIERLYVNVPRLWAPYVFSDRIATRLLPPLHGDASGVRGAAWLWPADASDANAPQAP
ncbi:MAG TPA: ROK family protein [Alphaproteobacteria bacterium]|nr:ROK family protein [Alphaproteobacteria bacterium]